MSFRKKILNVTGTRLWEVSTLVSILYLIANAVNLFIKAKFTSMGFGSAVIINYVEIFCVTGIFLISVFFSLETGLFGRRGFLIEAALKKDIDERIQNAQIALQELKMSIKEGVKNSQYFDSYARELVLQKAGLIFNKCQIRLEKAEKLREDIERIPSKEVKKKLEELKGFLIEGVSTGIVQLGDIHARIQKLNFSEDLDDQDIKNIAKELDDELAIAEKVDKKMNELDYGKDKDYQIR